MWSSVTAAGTENGPAPPSRSKHSATLLAGHVYLLGGRNGNLPLKDLWRYSLGEFACQSLARIAQIVLCADLLGLQLQRERKKKKPS